MSTKTCSCSIPNSHDKPLYALYKRGSKEHGADFESQVDREQTMIETCVRNMGKYNLKGYLEYCEEYIQNTIMPITHLPPSPSDSSPELPPTIPFSVRLADAEGPRKRITNATSFEYDTPKRRLTSKKPSLDIPFSGADASVMASPRGSCPSSSNALPDDAAHVVEDSLAADPPGEPMDIEEGKEDDFQNDAEAANEMFD